MSNLGIRAAGSDDSERISELICVSSERFITGGFSSRGRDFLLETMTPAAILKFMENGYRYHVAEIGDRLVGVVAVRDNRHLYHLFVAEDCHRQGIGRKLWELAMEECLNNEEVDEFTVNSSEYAQEVYKSLGFVAEPGPRIKNGVVFYPMSLRLDARDQSKQN